MADSFIDKLVGMGAFSTEDAGLIAERFVPFTVERDEHILKEGQVCKFVGFVETGLLMYYKVSNEGEEIVADFAKENEWVSQYESFMSRTPSALFIKALEPCQLHTISLDHLNELYERVPGFEKLAKQMVEKVFMDMVKRSLELQNLKAEDRYQKLVTDYPFIIQRVPQYYVASFLGIAPQSLSRIRKNRAG
jgi:CRP-like cAMP-binding protein